MNKILVKIYFAFIILFLVVLLDTSSLKAASTEFKLEIKSFCGNLVKESDEECDGLDFGGSTCINLGFNSGSLNCTASCALDISNCKIKIPSTGSNSGPSTPEENQTTLIFSGLTYPNSELIILKDGQQTTTTIAKNNSTFKIILTGLSEGHYIFSLLAKDESGQNSFPITFPLELVFGSMTEVKNIILPPTLNIDKTKIEKGENIKFFGQAVPNSEVQITLYSESGQTIILETMADNLGKYFVNYNTQNLIQGEKYIAVAESFYMNFTTIKSYEVEFILGEELDKKWKCGDLNEDWQVNLIDFSIGAFWYKKPLSEPLKIKEKQVLNGDGIINIADFSIMAYCWTG